MSPLSWQKDSKDAAPSKQAFFQTGRCSINTVMLNLDMILKVTWVMTTVGFAVLLSDYLRLRQQECRNTTDAEGPPKLPDRDYVQQGSSMWCWGDNNTNRMCKFSNLCFSPKHQHFVFFHGEQTVTHGIHNRFQPALVDLSSVPDHNTQYFQYVDLPVSALREFKKVKIYPRTSLIFNRTLRTIQNTGQPAGYEANIHCMEEHGTTKYNHTSRQSLGPGRNRALGSSRARRHFKKYGSAKTSLL
ncbi:POMGNT2 [Branchiostoma lanceolatum]|uniref:POMGNT2 protein n=1 Tax=Branchiostoma lanceolatum TaxID=7740 RepID=A0A8K0A962_BRALA|nr:POMGNT2 [Branchiostoma lanceolatum]